MLPSIRDHSQFRAFLEEALPRVWPKGWRSQAEWKDLRVMVEATDVGILTPVVLPLYSERGRPAWDPGDIVRTLLVMEDQHAPSFDDFAHRLRREPVLAVLCGFDPDRTPGASTLRDFDRRLYRGAIRSLRIGPHSRRRHLKLKGGAKLPPRHVGIVGRAARACRAALRRDDKPSSPDPVHDRLLGAAVQESAALRLFGDLRALKAGIDGSPLRSGANAYGGKICACEGRCACLRRFSDPDARAGWDSREHHPFFGYTFAGLVAGEHHDLPLTLGLYDAKRHEGTILPRELVKFHRLYPDFALSHVIADGAYDQTDVYRLLNDLGIAPVVDPRDPTRLRKPGPFTTPYGISWNAKGQPVCRRGHPMRRRGRAARGRPRWACPLATSCPRPCPLQNHLFVVNDRHNPRLCGDAPYGSKAWEALYPRRTKNERFFAEVKAHTGLGHARHRRRYRWLGRLLFAALLRHVKAWLQNPAPALT